MNWPQVVFEKLYAIPSKNGLNRPSRVRGNGYKMINMGELFAHDRIWGSVDMERVPMNDRELKTMLVEYGDLLFARQSLLLSGAGKCTVIKSTDEPTTFESHIIRVRLKSDVADPDFYHYYFKSPVCRIKSIVTQGVQAGIRATDLAKISVHCPPIQVQRSISTIMRSYDDMIENNRRRLHLLEESARMLYREWFVYFRFPGHEHVKVVNGVPKGWVQVKLGDKILLNYGKALKEEVREAGSYFVYGSSGEVGTHSKPLVKGPGIIIGRKGNVGSAYWSFNDYWPIDTVYFIITEQSSYYLFYALQHMQLVSSDAAVPGLNRDFAYSRPYLIPTAALARQFEETVALAYRQIVTLERENNLLKQARDLLLPRLMNGEIKV